MAAPQGVVPSLVTTGLGIITHTPPWAWLLLGYLVWQGIRGMQSRTTTI